VAIVAPAGWRILLSDDHLVVRAGLRALLADDARCQVVGESSTIEETFTAARHLRPDLIVPRHIRPGDPDRPGLDGGHHAPLLGGEPAEQANRYSQRHNAAVSL